MAARVGLKPWEAAGLSPREIRELYNGMMWRHSRMIEALATHALLVRAMLTKDDTLDKLLSVFPYYQKEPTPDGES